jgi:hypothetical protein
MAERESATLLAIPVRLHPRLYPYHTVISLVFSMCVRTSPQASAPSRDFWWDRW